MFYRDLENDDREVFFDALTDPSYGVMCPVKLLVIFALRTGQSYGTTVAELLDHTAQRVDRTVQWKNPKAPVLCRMKCNSALLVLDHPAPQRQITRTIKEMALIAGLLAPVTAMSVRRGSARDNAYLKKRLVGVADSSTALTLGHKPSSLASGLTARYVGPLQEAQYNFRAEAGFVDRLAPAVAVVPMEKTTLKSWQIDQYMDEHKVDKLDEKARARAATAIKSRAMEEWRVKEKNRTVSDPTPPSKKRKTEKSLYELTASEQNIIPRTKKHPQDSESAGGPLPQPTLPVMDMQDIQSEALNTHPPVDIATIDPRLLTEGQLEEQEVDPTAFENLYTAISGSSSLHQITDEEPLFMPTGWDEEAVDSALVAALISEDQGQIDVVDPMLLHGNEFAAHFASINVYKILSDFDRSDPSVVAEFVPTGNSREGPVSFMFSCQIGQCTYSHWSPNRISEHEVTCDGTTVERPFACPWDGCGKPYKNNDTLQKHIARDHTWTPRKCASCPERKEVYDTYKEWATHQRKEHDNELPDPLSCPLEAECHSGLTFTKKSNLKQHLRNAHKRTPEHIKSLVPATKRKLTLFSSECPLGNCKHPEKTYHVPAHVRSHLEHAHKLSPDEAARLVPLNDQAKKYATTNKEPQPSYQCPLETCTSKTWFPAPSQLKKHLESKTQHGMDIIEAKNLAEKTFGKAIQTRKTEGGRV